MKDCVEVGVKGAIIISAGFKETGTQGAILESEIMTIAREGNIRVVGPNCLGVMVSKNRSRMSIFIFSTYYYHCAL